MKYVFIYNNSSKTNLALFLVNITLISFFCELFRRNYVIVNLALIPWMLSLHAVLYIVNSAHCALQCYILDVLLGLIKGIWFD